MTAIDAAIEAVHAASRAVGAAVQVLTRKEEELGIARDQLRLAIWDQRDRVCGDLDFRTALYWDDDIPPGYIADALGCEPAQLHRHVRPLPGERPCRTCASHPVTVAFSSKAALREDRPTFTTPGGRCAACREREQEFMRRRQAQMARDR